MTVGNARRLAGFVGLAAFAAYVFAVTLEDELDLLERELGELQSINVELAAELSARVSSDVDEAD